MRFSPRSKLSILFSLFAIAAVVGGFMATGAILGRSSHAQAASSAPAHIDCSKSAAMCTELNDPYAFGYNNYVGHDEPSTLFYSNKAGSGNNAQWHLNLPKDPTPGAGGVPNPGQIFNFQLHGAFWFGMAMCDTQSYPEQISTCPADSDGNILDPATSNKHAGTAFTELQFYPPGWVPWPTWALALGASSCDPTRWCVALNIDSLSENPVTGQLNNATCLGTAGLEYVNFAFLTKNGVATGPASPLLSTIGGTFTPNPAKDLFMNSGDKLVVTMHDSPNGLVTDIKDQTTGAHGFMTASAANGFGQVKFDPTASSCTNIPYNFHPMYSTSSEQTRVIWAAHTYNVGFSDEIGHWDFCNGATVPTVPFPFAAACPAKNTEGFANDTEPSFDTSCFPASQSSFIKVQGCTDQDAPGFDGVPYHSVWPDGNPLYPTAIQFSSPMTGPGYSVRYSRVAFEADLAAIEASSGTCSTHTGAGCSLIPTTDDGAPAAFYPFFSITKVAGKGGDPCVWQLGNHIPGSTNDFGQNAEYGTLLAQTILSFTPGSPGGFAITRYENFRQILSKNPC